MGVDGSCVVLDLNWADEEFTVRHHVLLFVNGQRHLVSGNEALLSLSEFLRTKLRLTGTKIVCSEGDCGSCSVLVARLGASTMHYQPIDSCIAFLFQLDGCHVITVEGIGGTKCLSSVQQAMVDCHGSQCGFCTPGFIMTMTGVMEQALETNKVLSEDSWRIALTGNLCRCTGYTPILNACNQLDVEGYRPLEPQFPIAKMQAEYAPLANDPLEIACDLDQPGLESGDTRPTIHAPRTLEQALAIRSRNPDARIVAGATDVGVQWNKRGWQPKSILCLNRVSELRHVQVSREAILFGSGVTWTDMLPHCAKHLPQFREIVEVFGSPQIRNMGTLGGNVANASPIADSLPLYHVLECELELANASRKRWVNINKFYLGYKRIDLGEDEIITQLKMPLPRPDEWLKLFKVSRRRDMDISTFTAAIRMTIHQGTIRRAGIAFGAVGPIVIRLKKTESFLLNKPFTADTMQLAGEIAVEEITPISDVRGSADYRFQLAKNILLKFYYDLCWKNHPA